MEEGLFQQIAAKSLSPKCNDSHDNDADDNTWLLLSQQWFLEIFLRENIAR